MSGTKSNHHDATNSNRRAARATKSATKRAGAFAVSCMAIDPWIDSILIPSEGGHTWRRMSAWGLSEKPGLLEAFQASSARVSASASVDLAFLRAFFLLSKSWSTAFQAFVAGRFASVRPFSSFPL